MDFQESPNAEAVTVWNEIVGPKFLRFRTVFVRGAGAHSTPALERHGPPPGARVLEVGCGCGENAIEIAQRVGPTGSVLGVDVVERFVEIAREDAARAGVENVEFEIADAQIESFQRAFDFVFARFGTMFFASPVAAFRNLSRAIVPGGRALFITWAPLEDNPIFAIPKQIALDVLPPPPDKGVTCGPGPFSQADPETVRGMLEAGGFTDVAFERNTVEMLVGDTLEQCIDLQLMLGPAGELVREAGEEGERRRPALEARLKEKMSEHLRPDGVYMPASSWIITARPK